MQKEWPFKDETPFRYFIGDVRDAERLKVAMEDVDIVIHAAAFSFPPESENNKAIYYKNNILKTKKFINNCSKVNVNRFIFLSSSNVYNFNLKSIKPAKESQKIKPENYYGMTKAVIEKYLMVLKLKLNF